MTDKPQNKLCLSASSNRDYSHGTVYKWCRYSLKSKVGEERKKTLQLIIPPRKMLTGFGALPERFKDRRLVEVRLVLFN